MMSDRSNYGIKRSNSWQSLASVVHKPNSQQSGSRNTSRFSSTPNSRNTTIETVNTSRVAHNRTPRHTVPMKQIVKVIDPLKIRYIEQNESAQLSSMGNDTENYKGQRPQSARIRIQSLRNPSPTPPIRMLHTSRDIAPENVRVHVQQKTRPIRFKLENNKDQSQLGELGYAKKYDQKLSQNGKQSTSNAESHTEIQRYMKPIPSDVVITIPPVSVLLHFFFNLSIRKTFISGYKSTAYQYPELLRSVCSANPPLWR
ncbi:hypothetical protein AKO1_007046 [Acrasis kona]|uniref:Uncharacterized protein n=1 Tax=Acrasis kona TaxID=1008807 RepID=A0AAW2YTA5_9EUKA